MWDALSIVKLFTPFVSKNATQVYLDTDVYRHILVVDIFESRKSRAVF
jgi:hypothetical protein